MGLFSFLTQDIAVDLGTANTIIICNDKMVVNEPSIVAIDRKTEKVIAIGEKARQMQGKTHDNIKTIRPLRDGVIADFNAAEQMLRGMIKMASVNSKFFSPSLRIVVCIPSGSTEVEVRAVRDSSEHAGGRDVYMIYGGCFGDRLGCRSSRRKYDRRYRWWYNRNCRYFFRWYS